MTPSSFPRSGASADTRANHSGRSDISVVEVEIQIERCLDLTTGEGIATVKQAYASLKSCLDTFGKSGGLDISKSTTTGGMVVEMAARYWSQVDAVRGVTYGTSPIFPGCALGNIQKSHIAVRDLTCIGTTKIVRSGS